MTKQTRTQRFIRSKCDRCGRATPARQNGIGDLFVLPDDFEELRDCGDFCQPCISRYDLDDWREWFRKNRPELD